MILKWMIDDVISEVDNCNLCRGKQGKKSKRLHYGELEGTTESQMTCRKD